VVTERGRRAARVRRCRDQAGYAATVRSGLAGRAFSAFATHMLTNPAQALQAQQQAAAT
jgi:hypothetical protein